MSTIPDVTKNQIWAVSRPVKAATAPRQTMNTKEQEEAGKVQAASCN